MKSVTVMHDEDPIEEPQPKKSGKGAAASGLAGIGLIALKYLAVVVKLVASSWTFLLSLVFYVAFFGWRLGIVILLALAAHELGHYFAYRAYGLSARLPVFIPFFGAYTAGAVAPDLEQDAYIALAGPLTGLALAGACLAVGDATNDNFWRACADVSAFLNLFNMIPVLPFDGGRVIGAVWPPLWIAGVILFVVAAWWLHVPIFLVLIIALLGLPAMWSALRGNPDPRSATMTTPSRARVSLWYVATAAGLVMVVGAAHGALPSNGSGL